MSDRVGPMTTTKATLEKVRAERVARWMALIVVATILALAQLAMIGGAVLLLLDVPDVGLPVRVLLAAVYALVYWVLLETWRELRPEVEDIRLEVADLDRRLEELNDGGP